MARCSVCGHDGVALRAEIIKLEEQRDARREQYRTRSKAMWQIMRQTWSEEDLEREILAFRKEGEI